MPKRSARARVFLNLPYDPAYQKLFLAYLCGVHAFGMEPHVALEIPGGARRLERIISMLQSCEYSIHDLSKVQLDQKKPKTPRFNMPFELGLAVALSKMGSRRHVWFVMESTNYRLAKSLSDLNGTDAYIHGARIDGVFRELGNALVRRGRQPSVRQMWAVYAEIRGKLPEILKRCGSKTVFEARVFEEISYAANVAASGIVR